jgi:hypothetical protein
MAAHWSRQPTSASPSCPHGKYIENPALLSLPHARKDEACHFDGATKVDRSLFEALCFDHVFDAGALGDFRIVDENLHALPV